MSDTQHDLLLTERLVAEMSEAISIGRYPAGSKLSEPKLAAEYGVSRASLREAIRKLEERKLVTRAPRVGVRVVVPSQEHARELFDIREMLEGLAARLAAEQASVQDIADLRALLAMHREKLGNADAMVYWQDAANADFHFMLARMSKNTQLIDLLCGEYYPLYRLYRLKHALKPGRAQRALIEHERIVEAIADRDGALAEILMRRHIASTRAGLEL